MSSVRVPRITKAWPEVDGREGGRAAVPPRANSPNAGGGGVKAGTRAHDALARPSAVVPRREGRRSETRREGWAAAPFFSSFPFLPTRRFISFFVTSFLRSARRINSPRIDVMISTDLVFVKHNTPLASTS